MKERTVWVDYVKAIGIILVVYGHVAGGVFGSGMIEDVKLFWLVDSIVYSFHMPLFFCLSGLFFRQSLDRRGTKSVLFSKLDTIVYPYIVWSLLQGFVEVFLSSYTNGNTTSSEVLSLLWQPRAQFWFLYALFMVFVFAVFIFSKVSSKYTSVIFFSAVALYLFQTDLSTSYHLNYLSANFVYFVFGMLISRLLIKELPLTGWLLTFSFVIFVLAQYLFHSVFELTRFDKGFYLLSLALVSILFTIILSMFLARRSLTWLSVIGASSMPIYLMHMLVLGGVRVVLIKVFDMRSVSVHLLVGCLMCLLIPVIVTIFIKHYRLSYVFSMPIGKWMDEALQNILKKKVV